MGTRAEDERKAPGSGIIPPERRETAPTLFVPTKLARPPLRPGAVARSRLLDRLADIERSPLTLVSAAAGFGKTTLLTAWAATRGGPIAWLGLDPEDNDPARFWRYVATALETVQAGVGTDIHTLWQASQPPPLAALVTTLIEVCGALPAGTVLVLDDYHLITAPSIHDALVAVLAHLPSAMHIILATRADPPLPLARLRARGQLLELRAADLRFTADEAASFLRDAMGLDLPMDALSALETRTEGWAAGLQLAALAVRGRADPSAFVAAFSGSHRFVLDYLAEEVLQTQPERMQRFLLHTSLLDHLCAALCDAVTGEHDGQALLEEAEQANLFLVPLDEERRWYRYHHLFAEVLRSHLHRAEPDLIPTLHLRATDWYAQQGQVDKAIGHALAGGAPDRAAVLIERSGPITLYQLGEVATVRGWLHVLPEEVVRTRPRLCLLHAYARIFTGPHAEIEPWLRAAEAALPDDATVRAPLLGQVYAMRGFAAGLYGEAETALECARRAIELLPEADIDMRAMATYAEAQALHLAGVAEPARAASAYASGPYRAGGRTVMEIIALMASGSMLELAGRLRDADAVYREAITRCQVLGGRPLPAVCYPSMARADLLREWNRLDEALRLVEEGIAQAERIGNMDVLGYGYLILAGVRQDQGHLEAAGEALRRAEDLAAQVAGFHLLAAVTARRVRLWLAQGDRAAAARWLQQQGETRDRLIPIARELIDLARARVALALGRTEAALALLDDLLRADEAAGRVKWCVEILVLQARCHQASGDGLALDTLRRALALGEPQGFVRTFTDEGAPMAALLRALLAAEQQLPSPPSTLPSAAYIGRLLAVCTPLPAAQAFMPRPEGVGGGPASGLRVPLTVREREVLVLIVDGLTNVQIAARLVVELSTVKSHVNTIYTKLDAQNRTGAVARAHALHLLDA